MPKPKNISPTLDPSTFETIGHIDDAGLEAELLIDFDAAEEEEAKPPTAK